MRALAAILVVLLAVPAWAQDPQPAPAPEPAASDVPRTVKSAVTIDDEHIGPGTWMSPSRAAWFVAKQTTCEADKKQLQDALEKKPIQPPETSSKIAMGVTLGAAGGALLGALAVLLGLVATGHIK